MKFDIDPVALERMVVTPAFPGSVRDEFQGRGDIASGSMSSTGCVNRDLLPAEARLRVRLSMLSFEEDWNAPGMEAYDAL